MISLTANKMYCCTLIYDGYNEPRKLDRRLRWKRVIGSGLEKRYDDDEEPKGISG
jgi:hypothetical protein